MGRLHIFTQLRRCNHCAAQMSVTKCHKCGPQKDWGERLCSTTYYLCFTPFAQIQDAPISFLFRHRSQCNQVEGPTKGPEVLVAERRDDEEDNHFEGPNDLKEMGSKSMAKFAMPLCSCHCLRFVYCFWAHPLLVIVFPVIQNNF